MVCGDGNEPDVSESVVACGVFEGRFYDHQGDWNVRIFNLLTCLVPRSQCYQALA